jgi:hypothetical protein
VTIFFFPLPVTYRDINQTFERIRKVERFNLFLKAHKSVVFFVTYLTIIGQTTFERIDRIENTHVSLFLKRKVHKKWMLYFFHLCSYQFGDW